MQRRIKIDGLTYICNVCHNDETEFWTVSNAKVLANYLTKQGYRVTDVHVDGIPQVVEVEKKTRIFEGQVYFLNQCEGDLLEWISNSVMNDFTYYYDKVLFNSEDGFIAAYRDDINNNWKF